MLVNAARASRVENQDAIDACIVGMLVILEKQERASLKSISFLLTLWTSVLLSLILMLVETGTVSAKAHQSK